MSIAVTIEELDDFINMLKHVKRTQKFIEFPKDAFNSWNGSGDKWKIEYRESGYDTPEHILVEVGYKNDERDE